MAQEAINTGEELIEKLDSLRIEMNTLVNRLNASGVERTNGLRQTMGRDCEYYTRSLNIFLNKDYISIRNLLATCHGLFETIEGHTSNE